MVNAISAKQCRMARAALDWSQLHLAERSGVGSTSIKKFELGAQLRPRLLAKLRHSMEAAGIEFIDAGEKVRGRRAAFGAFLASDAPSVERRDGAELPAVSSTQGSGCVSALPQQGLR